MSDDLKKLAEREMAATCGTGEFLPAWMGETVAKEIAEGNGVCVEDGLTWAHGKCRNCGMLAARRDVAGAVYDPTDERWACTRLTRASQSGVRVKRLTPTAKLPTYATDGAAGADLYADEHARFGGDSPASCLVSTGIAIQIPPGYEGQIRPRSGWAARDGVTVLNAPGTIDSDYRGEIKVLLVSVLGGRIVVAPGDRIAQLVIAPVCRAEFIESDELDDTKRGDGGFGSTGK